MGLSRLSRRWKCAWVAVSLALPGALASLPSRAQAPDVELEAARDLTARDPPAAGAALARLRREAIAQGDAARRLAVDEADCRRLNETDSSAAADVGAAGLAAAAPQLERPGVRAAAWRLQVCHAATSLDLARTDAGDAELERVLAQTRDGAEPRPDDTRAAEAMALLERGLHRSRRGELVPGQADLLAACGALEALRLTRDLELCHWHLGNHYKRVGDADEALRLIEPLLELARRRGATADMSVYLLGIAQARFEQQDWEAALRAYRESIAVAESLGDTAGMAYAEYGVGITLMRLGRPQEALPHAQRARTLLGEGDPVQGSRITLLHAQIYEALQRPADALAELQRQQATMEGMRDNLLGAEWLVARAAAEARLGRWEQAYASLDAARKLDQRVNEQRLSKQSARLRTQFNREKDAAELTALRRVNEQGERLRQTQTLALVLFVLLLGAALWFALHKLRETRRLRQLAMFDELTGLANRRAVLEQLDAQRRHARRLDRALAVLVIDVDRFKLVNDGHGHAVGDEVLRHVARVIAGSLRANDRVGRVGGEEFLVVLPEANLEHAHAIAERMRQLVAAARCETAAGVLTLTVSIGAAVMQGSDESAAALIARADAALYAAKAGGRNRVCTADSAAATPIAAAQAAA